MCILSTRSSLVKARVLAFTRVVTLPSAQFFLIYYDEETCRWIEDHKKIVSSYLRTWFILDVIAILPFDFLGIFMHVSGLSKLKVRVLVPPAPCK